MLRGSGRIPSVSDSLEVILCLHGQLAIIILSGLKDPAWVLPSRGREGVGAAHSHVSRSVCRSLLVVLHIGGGGDLLGRDQL